MHPSLCNPFTTSAASVMRAVEPAAAPVTRPTSAAAAEPIHNSDGVNVPAQMQGSNDCGLARDDVRPGDTMQGDRSAHSATAPSETNHINEIFWFVRTKLMGQPRFVLNEAEFMAAIDEQPMFLQKRA